MKKWIAIVATFIMSMVVCLSVAYADEMDSQGNKTVSVRFVWDDLNDQAKVRPESVAVVLKANGDKMYTKMVNSDTWSDTFYDLLSEIDGEEVDDSIEQYMVPNAGLVSEYIHVSTEYNEAENCYVITNRYREGQEIVPSDSNLSDTNGDAVKEEVLEEIENYEGIDYNLGEETVELNSEIFGEKMDETPKTVDMYKMFLVVYGILIVSSVSIIGYLIVKIRKLYVR